ncbi:alcohol dehydrogenase [Lichtheimia corymbifera JMRC:FSU:9682]|uniref:Alcohol dehydrogenase n=1 Tax=Lichtheimia corymbifera JMRC:FSU:9682 TaxID=1263082 RepID=A0A068S156_9FUNG|nr:alcohol dehydrogenase [Lichtheimia corymbifera JMRC:FSU:9682]
MRATVLTDIPNPDKSFEYSAQVKEYNAPEAKSHEAVVKIQAAAMNHRDVWILKGQYFGIKTDSVLGSDAVGQVVSSGDNAQVGKRVLLCPSVNWDSDPRGPEGEFSILGLLPSPGTFAESINIDSKSVFPCPEHLSTEEAAALPLAGLTAYRAVFTKAQVQKGDHILITGIGGGVALFALQFAVAAGANVYISSSSADKINKAVELGAKGGINYKDPNAMEQLDKLLNGAKLSAIVDGAGGALFNEYLKVLRQGGYIVQYGQTASPSVSFRMNEVAQNLELRGSTMGSRAEFKQMVEFVDKHKIHPVVSKVFHGLNQQNVDDAIDLLRTSNQFGKVVIEI